MILVFAKQTRILVLRDRALIVISEKRSSLETIEATFEIIAATCFGSMWDRLVIISIMLLIFKDYRKA